MFIGIAYQEVPMPSDSSYNIGVTDNGDTYTGTILNGSGHLRVRVDPDCVTVDYVAAWLPQDTLGANKNCEIRHTQSLFRQAFLVEGKRYRPLYSHITEAISHIKYARPIRIAHYSRIFSEPCHSK
jgi:hypothetical protein